eukprot:jgi/Mesvir1/20371/Mv16896-RA.2
MICMVTFPGMARACAYYITSGGTKGLIIGTTLLVAFPVAFVAGCVHLVLGVFCHKKAVLVKQPQVKRRCYWGYRNRQLEREPTKEDDKHAGSDDRDGKHPDVMQYSQDRMGVKGGIEGKGQLGALDGWRGTGDDGEGWSTIVEEGQWQDPVFVAGKRDYASQYGVLFEDLRGPLCYSQPLISVGSTSHVPSKEVLANTLVPLRSSNGKGLTMQSHPLELGVSNLQQLPLANTPQSKQEVKGSDLEGQRVETYDGGALACLRSSYMLVVLVKQLLFAILMGFESIKSERDHFLGWLQPFLSRFSNLLEAVTILLELGMVVCGLCLLLGGNTPSPTFRSSLSTAMLVVMGVAVLLQCIAQLYDFITAILDLRAEIRIARRLKRLAALQPPPGAPTPTEALPPSEGMTPQKPGSPASDGDPAPRGVSGLADDEDTCRLPDKDTLAAEALRQQEEAAAAAAAAEAVAAAAVAATEDNCRLPDKDTLAAEALRQQEEAAAAAAAAEAVAAAAVAATAAAAAAAAAAATAAAAAAEEKGSNTMRAHGFETKAAIAARLAAQAAAEEDEKAAKAKNRRLEALRRVGRHSVLSPPQKRQGPSEYGTDALAAALSKLNARKPEAPREPCVESPPSAPMKPSPLEGNHRPRRASLVIPGWAKGQVRGGRQSVSRGRPNIPGSPQLAQAVLLGNSGVGTASRGRRASVSGGSSPVYVDEAPRLPPQPVKTFRRAGGAVDPLVTQNKAAMKAFLESLPGARRSSVSVRRQSADGAISPTAEASPASPAQRTRASVSTGSRGRRASVSMAPSDAAVVAAQAAHASADSASPKGARRTSVSRPAAGAFKGLQGQVATGGNATRAPAQVAPRRASISRVPSSAKVATAAAKTKDKAAAATNATPQSPPELPAPPARAAPPEESPVSPKKGSFGRLAMVGSAVSAFKQLKDHLKVSRPHASNEPASPTMGGRPMDTHDAVPSSPGPLTPGGISIRAGSPWATLNSAKWIDGPSANAPGMDGLLVGTPGILPPAWERSPLHAGSNLHAATLDASDMDIDGASGGHGDTAMPRRVRQPSGQGPAMSALGQLLAQRGPSDEAVATCAEEDGKAFEVQISTGKYGSRPASGAFRRLQEQLEASGAEAGSSMPAATASEAGSAVPAVEPPLPSPKVGLYGGMPLPPLTIRTALTRGQSGRCRSPFPGGERVIGEQGPMDRTAGERSMGSPLPAAPRSMAAAAGSSVVPHQDDMPMEICMIVDIASAAAAETVANQRGARPPAGLFHCLQEQLAEGLSSPPQADGEGAPRAVRQPLAPTMRRIVADEVGLRSSSTSCVDLSLEDDEICDESRDGDDGDADDGNYDNDDDGGNDELDGDDGGDGRNGDDGDEDGDDNEDGSDDGPSEDDGKVDADAPGGDVASPVVDVVGLGGASAADGSPGPKKKKKTKKAKKKGTKTTSGTSSATHVPRPALEKPGENSSPWPSGTTGDSLPRARPAFAAKDTPAAGQPSIAAREQPTLGRPASGKKDVTPPPAPASPKKQGYDLPPVSPNARGGSNFKKAPKLGKIASKGGATREAPLEQPLESSSVSSRPPDSPEVAAEGSPKAPGKQDHRQSREPPASKGNVLQCQEERGFLASSAGWGVQPSPFSQASLSGPAAPGVNEPGASKVRGRPIQLDIPGSPVGGAASLPSQAHGAAPSHYSAGSVITDFLDGAETGATENARPSMVDVPSMQKGDGGAGQGRVSPIRHGKAATTPKSWSLKLQDWPVEVAASPEDGPDVGSKQGGESGPVSPQCMPAGEANQVLQKRPSLFEDEEKEGAEDNVAVHALPNQPHDNTKVEVSIPASRRSSSHIDKHAFLDNNLVSQLSEGSGIMPSPIKLRAVSFSKSIQRLSPGAELPRPSPRQQVTTMVSAPSSPISPANALRRHSSPAAGMPGAVAHRPQSGWPSIKKRMVALLDARKRRASISADVANQGINPQASLELIKATKPQVQAAWADG